MLGVVIVGIVTQGNRIPLFHPAYAFKDLVSIVWKLLELIGPLNIPKKSSISYTLKSFPFMLPSNANSDDSISITYDVTGTTPCTFRDKNLLVTQFLFPHSIWYSFYVYCGFASEYAPVVVFYCAAIRQRYYRISAL